MCDQIKQKLFFFAVAKMVIICFCFINFLSLLFLIGNKNCTATSTENSCLISLIFVFIYFALASGLTEKLQANRNGLSLDLTVSFLISFDCFSADLFSTALFGLAGVIFASVEFDSDGCGSVF